MTNINKNVDIHSEMYKYNVTIKQIAEAINKPRPVLSQVLYHFELADVEKEKLKKIIKEVH